MRKDETKIYKGSTIRKAHEGEYIVGGYLVTFRRYADAKDAIDAADAEQRALDEAERYVQTVCGGWA